MGEVRKSMRSVGWDIVFRYGVYSEKRGVVWNKKDLGGDFWN